MLEAFKAAKIAAEPTRGAKEAERAAVAKAREERQAKRDQEKRDALLRAAAEAAAIAAASASTAEADAREAAADSRISRILMDDAAHKAKRDQRYANRKARQG